MASAKQIVELSTPTDYATLEYALGKGGSVVISLKAKNKTFRRRIMRFLNSKRDFKIPVSNRIDDYRVDSASPLSNVVYLELALSSMKSAVGITVTWSKETP